MAYFLLSYDLADDFAERCASVRTEHLTHVNAAVERGELIIAGILEEPVDTTMLLFHTGNASAVEAFAMADPYVRGGLVARWHMRRWDVDAGELVGHREQP